MFDEHNTKDWQQDGNGVFLLQECDPPSFVLGPNHPACENRFSIHVQSKNRADRVGEVEIAKRIEVALNGPVWQSERPTEPGDYYVSIAPEKRRPWPGFPAVIACEVALWAVDMDGYGAGLRVRYLSGGMWLPLLDNPWFDGARWLKRETPTDPFANIGATS